MADRERNQDQEKQEVTDAVRHVGPTLEAEGLFIPTGELPENRIENLATTDAARAREATEDAYDREADAMGVERLRTRLPGDRSSDPHTDAGADGATEAERTPIKGKKGGRAA